MPTTDLSGTRVAFLLTSGFEDSELTSPWRAVTSAGGTAVLVSPGSGTIVGKKGHTQAVDLVSERADAGDFDGLVLPGGVVNADHLRMDANAVAFTKAFFDLGKPVAAICHAPWILIEAGAASGRRLTSYPSLKTDLRNAGANWVDEQVVVDQGLVTSRTPDDLPAFNTEMVAALTAAARAERPAGR